MIWKYLNQIILKFKLKRGVKIHGAKMLLRSIYSKIIFIEKEYLMLLTILTGKNLCFTEFSTKIH